MTQQSRRPNILILMVDQLNGTLFPDGPADWLHAPNLKKLAERSARFANCYTASPLCAPARASFMSGQLPSSTRVYDNAAEFASDIPTYAHHLRRAGYQTALSGKMHFVGPDQLHGLEKFVDDPQFLHEISSILRRRFRIPCRVRGEFGLEVFGFAVVVQAEQIQLWGEQRIWLHKSNRHRFSR